MRYYRNIWILSFVILSCTNQNDTAEKNYAFYEPATVVKLDTTTGYLINQHTNDTIEYLVTPEGDTVVTGKTIFVSGKRVYLDSMTAPKIVKAGAPSITPTNLNYHYLPENLTTTFLDKSKLKVTTLGQGDSSVVLLDGSGDTINCNVPLIKKGKLYTAKQSNGVISSSFQMKDVANTNIKFLDVDQGLFSSYVFSLIRDKSDHVWFATYGEGLCKFDGNKLFQFSSHEGLAQDEITAVFEGSDGKIYAGGMSGNLSIYDGDQFINFYNFSESVNTPISDFLEDKSGNIWISSLGAGVMKYQPSSENTDDGIFTHFSVSSGLSSNFVTSIDEDQNGNLWFGTDHGVCKFESNPNHTTGTFTTYDESTGLIHANILTMMRDSKGTFWLGTMNGLVFFDGEKFIYYSDKDGLSDNRVRSLYEDSDHNLWIGTQAGGINKLDGEKFTRYSTDNGLSNNRVMSIMEDKNKNIWCGTWGGGVSVIKRNSFINYSEKQGLQKSVVFSTDQDKNGNLWFGAFDGGLTRYDGKSFFNYTEKQGLSGDYVRKIKADKNDHLWIGNFVSGVSKFDGINFTHYSEENGLSGNKVSAILHDKNGGSWFGSWGGGVCFFDHGINTNQQQSFIHYTSNEGLLHDYVLTIIQDRKGNLWFGTDGLLAKFTPSMSGQNSEGYLTHYSEKEGLPANNIFALMEDKYGNIWIGTNGGGVAVFDGETFTNYSEKQGLANNKVRSLLEDKKGNIWIATDGGLSYMKNPFSENKSSESLVETNPHIVSFMSKDGLKGTDFNTNSVYLDSNNLAYWGTGKSYVILDLNQFELNDSAPKIKLTQVDLNGKLFDYRDNTNPEINDLQFSSIEKFENYPHQLILPYTKNHLTFHFVALDWSAPDRIKYSYKMEGLTKSWSIPSTETKADFHSMPHGTYTFKVKAIGISNRWSDILEYTFTIHAPWWHTWWFRTIVTILFLVFIYFIFQWRTSAMRKRQVELEIIVSDRTAEVVQEKQAVEHQKNLLQEKNREILDSITYAKRLQEAILPSNDFVQKVFQESFVLYKPKDIVAGDFYWMESLSENLPNSDKTQKGVLFAAADCTGHGVPGAMVSVVCSNALNRAVKEFGITEPGKILDKVRDLVIETFEKSNSEVKDGMDISLFMLNGTKLQWAGANNPIWLIRNGENQIEEIKGDKQPIGKYSNPKPFTNHSFELKKGDTIYVLTDGFQDQFGGEKGKKFKASRIKELLLSVQNKSMAEQKEIMDKTFENWRGGLEQLDDVCFVGVRI